jgi:hypothetical protein
MAGRTNRLGNPPKWHGKAHFLDSVASEVAFHVAKWRAEAPEQWGERPRELDVERLRRVLHDADHMKLDPYLVAFLIMGTEWLFRVRPLKQEDAERSLDELELRLQRTALSDSQPWQASLIVGGIYPVVSRGLRAARYVVSLGTWAFPIHGWRDVVAGHERDRARKAIGDKRDSQKPGKVPVLSPIIAALIVDSLGAEVTPPRTGSRALALEVASMLRGRKIQAGEFGVWWRAAAGQAPKTACGVAGVSPSTLRDWLALRWKSAYQIRFEEVGRVAHQKRYWSTFLIEATHNPRSVFAALADAKVVTELYAIPWYHDLSPRRSKAHRPRSKRAHGHPGLQS